MKVLGNNDGKLTTSKHNTFCGLCSRRIYEGETCLTWYGRQFFIHVDCRDASERMTKMQFLRDGKKRSKKKTGRRPGGDSLRSHR